MEEILHHLGYPRMYKTYQLVQDFFHQQNFETLQLYDSPDWPSHPFEMYTDCVVTSRPGWHPHTAMVGAVKRKSRKFLWLNSSWALDERIQEELCFQLGHGTEISFCWMKLWTKGLDGSTMIYHVYPFSAYVLDFWSADIIRKCHTLCAKLCFETRVYIKSCAVVRIHICLFHIVSRYWIAHEVCMCGDRLM